MLMKGKFSNFVGVAKLYFTHNVFALHCVSADSQVDFLVSRLKLQMLPIVLLHVIAQNTPPVL